jgi:prepilin-type processing-associated H-X9-DG protein
LGAGEISQKSIATFGDGLRLYGNVISPVHSAENSMRTQFAMMLTLAALIFGSPAFFVSPVRADEITGDDAVITPYLSANILFIGRLDFSKFDVDALKTWQLDMAKDPATDKDMLAAANAMIDEEATGMKAWTADFQKAGGKRIYMLFDVSFLQTDPTIILVPIGPGADATALQNLLKFGSAVRPADLPADADNFGPTAMVVGGKVIVFGDKDAVAKITRNVPVARDSLLKAMAGAGDGAGQLAVEPTSDIVKFFSGMMPQLPPELGGGKTTDVLSNIKDMTVSVVAPPNAALKATVHCPTPDAAQSTNALVKTAIDSLNKQLAANQDGMAPVWGSLLAALTPTLDGSNLTIVASGDDLTKKLGGPMVMSMVRARQAAERVASMSNERQLLISCLMYSNDHNGAYPPALDVANLGQYVGGADSLKRIMTNPRHPDKDPGYVYVKPTAPSPDAVVIYEVADDKDTQVNVGFGDGHVEAISKDDLKAKLAAPPAAAPRAAPGGMGQPAPGGL